MDENTQKLFKETAKHFEGIVIYGQVADVRSIAGGTDRTSGLPYNPYTSCRVVTGLGLSVSVKLDITAGSPKQNDRCAFFCPRVWKGANGISAQADSFI